MGFLSSFAKGKLGTIQESITQKLVSWDPEGATEAEINEMIAELDKITAETAKAKAAYDKEKKEADAANANYARYVSAAELLNKKLETCSDDEKAGVEKSLTDLLTTLEKLKPEVEREEREAVEAQQEFEELKEFAQMTSDKVKGARAALENAQKDMRRAELDKKKSEERAARAEVMAGLRKDSGALGTAMSAMQKEAEASRSAAEAAKMKADLLGQAKKEDSNIADALKAVDGLKETTSMSVSERLAALKR